MCCVYRHRDSVWKPNPVTATRCLMQPYTTLPTPIPAPRCTEAESRMEQSRVRWQWHSSHAMNNQWTPSGAYNRGAQLQSFTAGWLAPSLPPRPTHCLTFSPSPSPIVQPFLSQFSHTNYHHTAPVSYFAHCLSVFFSIYIVVPCSDPHHRSQCSSVASLTGYSWYPSFWFSSTIPRQVIRWPNAL